MAPRVSSSMDFYKFCLIAFLIFNNGFPIKGVPESHSGGEKSPSVKECRVHIEAALEQYWETSEGDSKEKVSAPESTPSHSSSKSSQSLESQSEGPQSDDETDQDDDDIDPPVDVHSQDDTREGEDDDDEEEEENDDEEEEDDDEDDVNGDEDGDDDDDDEEEEEGDIDSIREDDSDEKKQTLDEELDAEEEDDDDDDDEDDEDETTDESQSTQSDHEDDVENEEDEVKKEESDEDEEEESDEDDEEKKADSLKEAEDELEEEEEVEENEESDANENEDSADDDEVSESITAPSENKAEKVAEIEEIRGGIEAEDEEEEEEEEEEEDHDEGNNESENDEDDEEEEEEETSEVKEEEEEEEEEDDEETESSEKEKSENDERGDKVTGETHSAPAGMAPELSETKPASDQPKASPVEEKATLESKDTEEEEEDEEEEEGEEETDEDDDDLIENIYEEEEDEEDLAVKPGEALRSREHVDAILGLDDIGTNYDAEGEKLAQSVFKDIKKIHFTNIKPMEMLYKYAESTTRLLGDAEIFSKPMVLFLGPWSSGKTTIINYLLGLERTPAALKTGTGITDLDFTVINYGEERRITSGTALAADWTYAGLQKFGQGLLDHFKGITIPHTLLKKITLVDTPGIIESKKNTERGYPFNDAFQWFIDRADAIYVVLDPTKVDIGAELGSVLDQLKGREARFILNKADTIRRSDLMRVVGQLFWNLSPLMSSAEAPVIYAVSLTTKPFQPSAPAKFLADQENNFLYDLRETMDKHVENRILYARRHAVRVRNHCKMVDCYLSTYYRNKSIFSSKKNVAKLITENPVDYNIYEGLSSMTNVSRYDLPDPLTYKTFFSVHPLYDFKPLVSTCSYFRGCPMDKLDLAISNELPELLAKYKKAKLDIPTPVKEEGR